MARFSISWGDPCVSVYLYLHPLTLAARRHGGVLLRLVICQLRVRARRAASCRSQSGANAASAAGKAGRVRAWVDCRVTEEHKAELRMRKTEEEHCVVTPGGGGRRSRRKAAAAAAAAITSVCKEETLGASRTHRRTSKVSTTRARPRPCRPTAGRGSAGWGRSGAGIK